MISHAMRMVGIKNMFIGLMVVILVALSACSDNLTRLTPGIYSGTFTVQYDSASRSGETTVRLLEDGQYTCDGNDDRIPAGGSGTYTISGETITFNDENMWTADFDWNLILRGQHTYTFRGKYLELVRIANGTRYQYHLRKLQEK